MESKSRETILKIIVAVVVGLYLLDAVVITPAFARWKAQGERVAILQKQVTSGRKWLERERSLRERWAAMQKMDLSDDNSVASASVEGGWARWAAESRVSTTSFSPTWRPGTDGPTLYEVRANVTNNQASLGQLIYSLETDPLPVRLEECEWTTRDAKGQQINAALRFTFIRFRGGAAR